MALEKACKGSATYIHCVMGVIREPCEATSGPVSLVPHRLAPAAARLGTSLACNRSVPAEHQRGGGIGVHSCLGLQESNRALAGSVCLAWVERWDEAEYEETKGACTDLLI